MKKIIIKLNTIIKFYKLNQYKYKIIIIAKSYY